jgi:predicted transcriptional regulator
MKKRYLCSRLVSRGPPALDGVEKVWQSNTQHYFHEVSRMTANALRPVAIKIDEDTKARVKRLADARQRSSHWLMREAITQYLDREEKREAFRRDTLKAWESFRESGLHVTADEADAWMDQLEQGNDVEPPACHA